MTLVWETPLPDSEKLVLLALADWANDDGVCWPSVKTLAKKCSKSERTVQNAVRSLRVKGHLDHQLTERGWRFVVHPIARFSAEPRGAKSAPPRKICTPPQPLHPTPAAVAPNTLEDTSSEAKASGASADPVKGLFDMGVELLLGSGMPEPESRSMVGKWRKEHGDTKVMAAFIDCRAKGITKPIEWLQKRLVGVKYVSASGYEYRGDARSVMREAEKRADWGTYWKAKKDAEEAA